MKGCLTNITSAFVLFGIGYFLLSLVFPSLDWGRVDTSRAHLPERVLDPALHYDLIFETIEVDGIASKMFKCLAKNKVNIRMISTSEIKISVVIDQKNLEIAVQALHNEFKLEKKIKL